MVEAEALTQAWQSVGLGTGGLVIGLALFVIWEYAARLPTRSAVPVHVVLIATSYVLYRVVGFVDQLQRFDTHAAVSYKLVLFSVGDVAGVVALVIILRAAVRAER